MRRCDGPPDGVEGSLRAAGWNCIDVSNRRRWVDPCCWAAARTYSALQARSLTDYRDGHDGQADGFAWGDVKDDEGVVSCGL